jgi:hypothetical protein
MKAGLLLDGLSGLLVGIHGIDDNISDLAESHLDEAHPPSLPLLQCTENPPGRRTTGVEDTTILSGQQPGIGQCGRTSVGILQQVDVPQKGIVPASVSSFRGVIH